MSLNQQALQEEERIFQQEVQAVRNWWKKDRFALVTRPYTPEEGTSVPKISILTFLHVVVTKRGTLVETYASDAQAKKLWSILMKHKANKTASFTYGSLDPVQVIQMGKYLETIYVSGWQSSSTASTSNEPGPDLADYPMVITNC
jgi:isocitrate lyase